MHFPFLIPRVERLRADGGFEFLRAPTTIGRLRYPVVLLARDLCTFTLFESSGLPKARRLQAARLHARTASPYVVGGARLVRCGEDYGIWWWDLERVGPLLSEAAVRRTNALRPETLAQPAGSGWRIVQLAEGYEAQYWSPAGLIASTWQAERFTPAVWSAFTRLVRGAVAAPEMPPVPSRLPISPSGEAFAVALADMSRNQVLGLVTGVAATALAGLTMFLLGQGLALRSDVAKVRKETESIRLATPQAGLTAGLETDRRRLAAYRQAEERTNPITATGAAIGIVSLYDLTPAAIEVGDGVLNMTLPYAAGRRADELVAEFEGSGYFFDVRPRTDAAAQSLIIEMQIRQAAPPLSLSE